MLQRSGKIEERLKKRKKEEEKDTLDKPTLTTGNILDKSPAASVLTKALREGKRAEAQGWKTRRH